MINGLSIGISENRKGGDKKEKEGMDSEVGWV